MNANTVDRRPVRGWVLYDGRCGFCSAGARRMAGLLRRLDFRTVPLQTPWVVEKLGTPPNVTPMEMAVLTCEGRVLQGVDAYLHVAEQFWWGKPFAWVARLRVVNGLLRAIYRWIAAHRLRISALCKLQPDLPGEKAGGL